ncbi:MAG: hypothetical protein EWV85_18785 [Microcystis aeruginosa Ma_QC_C_20070703_M131]|uniref:Uncharacterized protein n=1 Tax=Microcystis aeruginosa Ma_QC_C_20070703_M131 TaxID=2486263 RepID=A0A551XCD5_MICAE|nr:MAG: hypothetical protein EWV85_18785 [Microcystis aeruginosa Ma_QC_C_20070703_M131]
MLLEALLENGFGTFLAKKVPETNVEKSLRGTHPKSCLEGIGEQGAGRREKQSIAWELIVLLKTDLVSKFLHFPEANAKGSALSITSYRSANNNQHLEI